MTAYNVISPTSMATGQSEDISVVKANFDAIAAIINGGLDNANINAAAAIVASKLAGYPADATKFLRGDGAWQFAGLKTTVSTLAGGPPGAPADTDIWVATAVDANGTRWVFQYNAGSASAFKWEYIGGSALAAFVAASEATASAAYVDLATVGPSVTIARAGDYMIRHGLSVGNGGNSGGGNAVAAVHKNGVAFGLQAIGNVSAISGAFWSVGMLQKFTGLAAADVLKLMYSISNGVNSSFSNRWLEVTPVRIS